MICIRCNTDKAEAEFNACRKRASGKSPYCRVCAQAVRRKSYLKHKEKRDAEIAAWHTANRERCREKERVRYHANPGKAAAKRRRMYEKHIKKRRAYTRNYRKAKPHIKRASEAERRARKMAGYRTLTPQAKRQVADFYAFSGILNNVHGRAVFVVDHIVPLARGGAHVPENLRVATYAFNAVKSEKLDSELVGAFPTFTAQA